jgi:hypothetical protein
MFADPQVITINGSAKSLVRIGSGNGTAEYLLRSSTEEFRMNIRNTTYTDKKRAVQMDRHNVEFVHTVFGVSPAVDVKRKTYFVFENQKGDTLTDPVYDASGLLSWAVASSNAALTKMVNYEA